MTQRDQARDAFIESQGWGDARRLAMSADASTRGYQRLVKDADTRAIIMDWPAHDPVVKNGQCAPYDTIAHIASDVRAFVAIATVLRRAGLNAPEILGYDFGQGFLLLSDLGDITFIRLIDDGAPMDECYPAAVEALVVLYNQEVKNEILLPGGGHYMVPDYDWGAFHIEANLLLAWYYPEITGQPPLEDVATDFHDIMKTLLPLAQTGKSVYVIRDYHSPNLMWLPHERGLDRLGIIDFQDALIGHPAYDLVSLLQDARRPVPVARESAMLGHYIEQISAIDPDFDTQAFRAAYAIWGAQRAAKVIGIFHRLARRDNKPGYLKYIPDCLVSLQRNLQHDALAPLRDWCRQHLNLG